MIPWRRDWTLILRLADRLAHEHFDREAFLRLALEVFAEEMEPVVGIDPRLGRGKVGSSFTRTRS